MAENMRAVELLELAARDGMSDLFITAGCPIMTKRDGALAPLNFNRVSPEASAALVRDLFALAPAASHADYLRTGDGSCSVCLSGVGRFRVSAFFQRGTAAAVVRVLPSALPVPERLGIPRAALDLWRKTEGLILVTGPAGAGKSTTLAVLLDQINARRSCHIVTLEAPVKYLHGHKMALVHQREIGTDSGSYLTALEAALRQSPDVILIDALRDLPTIAAALTAAESGVLVLTSLPTVGAAASVERLIDGFTPARRPLIRAQLATTLQAVVSQRLLPCRKQGRMAVFEVMTATAAIRNMIRAEKTHQLDAAMHSGTQQGMHLMDYAIAAALKRGDITHQTAVASCTRPDLLERLV